MEDTNFFQDSTEIVRHFLQTVVAVDDNLHFDANPDEKVTGNLIEPDDDNGIGAQETDETISPINNAQHKLNYSQLSSQFAKQGIICSGLLIQNPTHQDAKNEIFQSSKNADVAILDWEMGDKGGLALSVINDLITFDKHENGRIRLIAIYTAENIDKIKHHICEDLKQHGYHAEVKDESIFITEQLFNSWKIVIVSKAHLYEHDLPNYLINSFTELTVGLLSNTALSAITEIRKATHHLIYQFHHSLDPAYLSHVFGLLSQKDMKSHAHETAFDYSAELLTEEIRSILQCSPRLRATLSEEKIKKWPLHINTDNNDEFFNILVNETSKKLGTELCIELLSTESNLKTVLKSVGYESDALKGMDRNPVVFSHSASEIEINERLCYIENVRNITDIESIYLKLGTIIREIETDKFFFCTQPLCDSIRLKKDTYFPLLEVLKAPDEKHFTHVIRVSGELTPLIIKAKPTKIRSAIFKINTIKKKVVPNKEGGRYILEAKSPFSNTDIKFEWICELKSTVSQSIINELAAQSARVGTDTFEYLRQKQRH